MRPFTPALSGRRLKPAGRRDTAIPQYRNTAIPRHREAAAHRAVTTVLSTSPGTLPMKTTTTQLTLLTSSIRATAALVTATFVTAAAADNVINKQILATEDMSMQDCKKHLKMSRQSTGAKDATMKLRDTHCAAMAKDQRHINKDQTNRNHDMVDESMMKRDSVPSDPMLK
jgi:hypothetical protein